MIVVSFSSFCINNTKMKSSLKCFRRAQNYVLTEKINGLFSHVLEYNIKTRFDKPYIL